MAIFHHFNHRGDVVLITDGGGEIVKSINYGAYGDVIGEEGGVIKTGPGFDSSMPEVFGGAYGIRRDNATGLDYMRFRWYANDLSSFISADRIHSPNRYNYAKGNPVKYADPMGLKETLPSEPPYMNPIITAEFWYHYSPINSIPPEPVIGYISSDSQILPVTQYMQNDSFNPINILKKHKIYYTKFHWTYLPYRNSFGKEISNLINCAGFAAGVEGTLNTRHMEELIKLTSIRVDNCKQPKLREGQIVVSMNWGHYGVVVNDNGKLKVIFTDGPSAVFVAPIDEYLGYFTNSEIWQPGESFTYSINGVPQISIIPGLEAVGFYHNYINMNR